MPVVMRSLIAAQKLFSLSGQDMPFGPGGARQFGPFGLPLHLIRQSEKLIAVFGTFIRLNWIFGSEDFFAFHDQGPLQLFFIVVARKAFVVGDWRAILLM